MLDLKFLTQALGDLEEDLVMEMLKEFTDTSPSEAEALEAVAACQAGMTIVGELFEQGEYFVGDLIFAGELLTEAINALKPALGGGASVVIGTILLGTVHGDLHDIGKNLVKMMMEGKGLEVIDLGTDVPPEKFVEAAAEEHCDIIACSALLTTTMGVMEDVVKAANNAGLRDKVKIMIGGAPVTEAFCLQIGADKYTCDATSAAEAAVAFCTA